MDYSSIFNGRAADYVRASTSAPTIREEEFAAYFDCLQLRPGERFLDAPCGSGQAHLWLPDQVEYLGLDPAPDFVGACVATGIPAVRGDMRATPLQSAFFDVVGSLTGVHHEAQRRTLYAEWWRVLKPGGRLVLIDVWEQSEVGRFLNGFVDTWNSQGHCGDFLSEADLQALESVGFSQLQLHQLRYAWNASSDVSMHRYMLDLFGLDKGPSSDIMCDAWRRLGWVAEQATCRVPWGLAAIIARKPR